MFIDTADIQPNAELTAELCIVGAGAAGIAMAKALIRSGIDVLLLEGGGRKKTKASQAIYRGKMQAGLKSTDHYVHTSRLRYFGGTSNHWAGWCRPLDPIDFEARDWVPHSGWPITRAELEPWYVAAAKFIGIGPFKDIDAWKNNKRRPFLLQDNPHFEPKLFHFAVPPPRFGKKYGRLLERSRTTRVVFDANVTAVRAHSNLKAVDHLDVRTMGGKTFTVRAKRYVLAAGGIENPRLLLSSDQEQAGGLGNGNDLVGRFFSDHLETGAKAGQLALIDPALVNDPSSISRTYTNRVRDPLVGRTVTRGIISISPETLKAERMLQVSMRPDLVRKTDLAEMGRSVGDAAAALIKEAESEKSGHVPCIVRTQAEPEPNPENRVRLSADRDNFGMRRVDIKWTHSDLENRSHIRAWQLLAREMGKAKLARVRVRMPLDPKNPVGSTHGAAHHMGTTRMHHDPKRGVVDANCRVFGIDNLYIAGSSVFPTYGWANPTTSLVALALRTASHLETLITAEKAP